MFDRLKGLKNQYEELLRRMEEPETYSDPKLYARCEREARELQPEVGVRSPAHQQEAGGVHLYVVIIGGRWVFHEDFAAAVFPDTAVVGGVAHGETQAAHTPADHQRILCALNAPRAQRRIGKRFRPVHLTHVKTRTLQLQGFFDILRALDERNTDSTFHTTKI